MDKRAKSILFKTYWSASGWRDQFITAPEDFVYAKEKGLMFDPITITHDECVKRIIKTAEAVSTEQVAKAFLSSLSTRRLDWRSGIASYYVAKLMTPHEYTPVVSGWFYEDGKAIATAHTCQVCKNLKYGVIGREAYVEADLNVLNFERIKWGGVRHGDLLYTLFDLEQFQKEPISAPTEEDVAIFKKILQAAGSCAPGSFPSVLRDKLKEIPELKANKGERDVILEILACIGVLKPAAFDRPTTGKNDWTFIEYWRGEDGYNQETVERVFGEFL